MIKAGEDTVVSEKCPSCDAALSGRYCSQCGEKSMYQEEMTLRYFFGSVWNAITFTDIKFLRSLSALLFKPGLLTQEYFQGRRRWYSRPLSLFFFINLVYFIYQPIDALNSQYISQTKGQVYSEWAEGVSRAKIEATGLSEEQFGERYNHMTSQVSKLFLVVFALIYAAFTALINVDTKKMFSYHLTSAVHFVSFAIFAILIMVPLLATLLAYAYVYTTRNSIGSLDLDAWYLTVPLLFILGNYIYKTQRRLFHQHTLVAILKSVLLLFCFILSILIYRFFLFVLTMALV